MGNIGDQPTEDQILREEKDLYNGQLLPTRSEILRGIFMIGQIHQCLMLC